MTVQQLIQELQKFPAELEVRYNYDTGHDYPTFKRVYIMTEEIAQYCYEKLPFVCLDEN